MSVGVGEGISPRTVLQHRYAPMLVVWIWSLMGIEETAVGAKEERQKLVGQELIMWSPPVC